MRLAVVVVDGAQAEESVRTWVSPDVPLVVVGTSDPVALARWADGIDATHVAVLTRPDTRARARLLTTVAAGRHPRIAFCVLTRDLSVLGLAACGMTALEARSGADDAIAHLQSMLATTSSGAWLQRVHKLRRPQPRFGQHLRSLLPGGRGYIAVMGADGFVTRTDKAAAAVPAHHGHLVSEAAEGSDAHRALSAVFATEANPLPPIGSTERRYGAKGAEFARLGQHDALPTHTCPVCSLSVAGTVCPFCRARITQETA